MKNILERLRTTILSNMKNCISKAELYKTSGNKYERGKMLAKADTYAFVAVLIDEELIKLNK